MKSQQETLTGKAMTHKEVHSPPAMPRPHPIPTQPGHHVINCSEEFCFFFLRVGIVKAQKTDTIVGLEELEHL